MKAGRLFLELGRLLLRLRDRPVGPLALALGLFLDLLEPRTLLLDGRLGPPSLLDRLGLDTLQLLASLLECRLSLVGPHALLGGERLSRCGRVLTLGLEFALRPLELSSQVLGLLPNGREHLARAFALALDLAFHLEQPHLLLFDLGASLLGVLVLALDLRLGHLGSLALLLERRLRLGELLVDIADGGLGPLRPLSLLGRDRLAARRGLLQLAFEVGERLLELASELLGLLFGCRLSLLGALTLALGLSLGLPGAFALLGQARLEARQLLLQPLDLLLRGCRCLSRPAPDPA